MSKLMLPLLCACHHMSPGCKEGINMHVASLQLALVEPALQTHKVLLHNTMIACSQLGDLRLACGLAFFRL